MNKLKLIYCLRKGHLWANDMTYATHGYQNAPVEGSYCKRCGIVAVGQKV